MTDDTLIEIHLPETSDTEAFFKLHLEAKVEVISLGIAARDVAQVHYKKCKDSDWNKRLQAELAIRDRKILDLEREREEEEKVREIQSRIMTDEMRDTVAKAVEVSRDQASKEIQALEAKNQGLYRRMREDEESQERRIESRIQASAKVLREEITRLTGCLERAQDKVMDARRLTDKSTDKGKHGELLVQGELNKLFPCGEVEDTHAEPHRGDFIVRNEGMTMMVEAKNYKRNVQKGEIDKFYKDVDNQRNNEYDCAILLSLSSGICNREDFRFEVRNDVPIMFIHNAADNFPAVRLAFKFFQAILSTDGMDLSARETVDTFRHIATALKRSITKQKAALDKNYTTQLELISGQQTLLGELFGCVKLPF